MNVQFEKGKISHKLLADLEASFAVLARNIKDYYEGNKHAYRPVAVELRKLLCDTVDKQDISLIPRMFPGIRLKPLRGSREGIERQPTIRYIPGLMYFDGKGNNKIYELIDENKPSLSIEDWLKQKIIDTDTTVRDLIRSVADKEGAHSDKAYNVVLKKTKTVKISTGTTLCDQLIVVIGRYVIKNVAILILNKDAGAVAKFSKEQYAELGRGGVILDLFAFANKATEGAPLEYKDKVKFITEIKGSVPRKQISQIIDLYQPENVLLLLVKDINKECWLYEQRINI